MRTATICTRACRVSTSRYVESQPRREPTPRVDLYIRELLAAVRDAVGSERSLDQTLAAFGLDESYLPPAGSPLAAVRPLMQGIHRWNVKMTYLEQNRR